MEGSNNILIRSVVESDMDAVIEILQSISDFKPSKSEYSNIWRSFDQQDHVCSLVAILDNTIVGYGSIAFETKIRGGKMGHIEDIVSHGDFRKKGIGRAILDALYIIAQENGCYKVTLQCEERNIEFYQKCGYKLGGFSMQILENYKY